MNAKLCFGLLALVAVLGKLLFVELSSLCRLLHVWVLQYDISSFLFLMRVVYDEYVDTERWSF